MNNHAVIVKCTFIIIKIIMNVPLYYFSLISPLHSANLEVYLRWSSFIEIFKKCIYKSEWSCARGRLVINDPVYDPSHSHTALSGKSTFLELCSWSTSCSTCCFEFDSKIRNFEKAAIKVISRRSKSKKISQNLTWEINPDAVE